MEIFFPTTPAVGTRMQIDLQVYELLAVEPYVRLDGAITELLRWEAMCAKCGATFHTTSTKKISSISRRCPEHRRAGSPASGRRGKKVTVTIVPPHGKAA